MAPSPPKYVKGFGLRDALATLRRNPGAARGILAVGMYIVVQNTPNALVVNSLQGEFWGKNMATYQAIVNFSMYSISILANGPLGRLGDRAGNRVAFVAGLLFTSLPCYALLICGANEAGLTVWAVARVLSGLSAASLSGSPACYALVNELTAPEDIDAMMGTTFAGVGFFWLASNLFGFLMMRSAWGGPRVTLASVAVLSWIAVATVATLRPRAVAAPAKVSDDGARDVARQGEGFETDEVTNKVCDQPPSQCEPAAPAGTGKGCPLLSALRMARGERGLWAICIIAALVTIPETVLFDIQLQYYFDALGLLRVKADAGQHHGMSDRVVVSLLTTVGTQLALIIGSLLAGMLAKRISPRIALLWLVPICAVLDCAPCILTLAPCLPLMAGCSAMLGLSLSVLPPVQSLVPVFAPTGRVSEAMGAVGAFKSFSSLLGNLIVSAVVPLLEDCGLKSPLMLLFPTCGVVTLSAFVVAMRLPAPPSIAGGSEAPANARESQVHLADSRISTASTPASEADDSFGTLECADTADGATHAV